jgi:hypothetical protein
LEQVADFKSESAADLTSESMADLRRNQQIAWLPDEKTARIESLEKQLDTQRTDLVAARQQVASPLAALQAVGAHPTAPTIAEPEPELLIAARLIDDADTQAKWYYRLKREHRRARAEGAAVSKPRRAAHPRMAELTGPVQ